MVFSSKQHSIMILREKIIWFLYPLDSLLFILLFSRSELLTVCESKPELSRLCNSQNPFRSADLRVNSFGAKN